MDLGIAVLLFAVGAAHGGRTCLSQDIAQASANAAVLVCRDWSFFRYSLVEGGIWFIAYGVFRTLFGAPRRIASGVAFALFLGLAGITEMRISLYRDVQEAVAAKAKEKTRAEQAAKEMERIGVDNLLAELEEQKIPIAERFKRCEALGNRALLYRCLTALFPKLSSTEDCGSLTMLYDQGRCEVAVLNRDQGFAQ